MPSITRPDLATADGVELTEHLQDAGFTQIATSLTPDGLLIEVDDAPSADAITAALADFTPTATRGEYLARLPAFMRDHVIHLKQYLQADPTTITEAQTVHVVKDIIRALRVLNDRLTE